MAEFKREEFLKEFGPKFIGGEPTYNEEDMQRLIDMVHEEFQVGDITVRRGTPAAYIFSLEGIYYGMLPYVKYHGCDICLHKPMDYLQRETPYVYSPFEFLLNYSSVTKHTRERIEVWQNLPNL